MKVRKTGNRKTVKLTFGEHSDKAKIAKLSNVHVRSKEGKQITKGLHLKKGYYPEDIRHIKVVIKGGYSKGYSKTLERGGTANDPYYYFGFYGDPDTQWTQKKILNHVAESMEKFTSLEPTKKVGSGATNAAPRISEVSIQYLYRR